MLLVKIFSNKVLYTQVTKIKMCDLIEDNNLQNILRQMFFVQYNNYSFLLLINHHTLECGKNYVQGRVQMNVINIKLLKMKCTLLYIRHQPVPRCKHFPPRL